jgi:hypothetical protein
MKLIFGLLTALFSLLSVVGGFGVGVGGFAYGIYMIILLLKGTIAVSFWTIFKVVVCWVCSGFAGWLTFMFLAFLATIFGALASDK